MNIENTNYFEQAITRVTQQFKGKINIERIMIIWEQGLQELQKAFLDILTINDVDSATGYNLDVIGDIVGQPRGLIQISSTGFFGFKQDPGAYTYGTLHDDSGGIWYSLDDPESGNVLLNDTNYEMFLKSKIIHNNTGSTPEDIIQAVKYIFQTDIVELFEGGTDPSEPAVITLNIGRPWNDPNLSLFPGLDETAIADRLIPRPVGVRIEYVDTTISKTLTSTDKWEEASIKLHQSPNRIYPDNVWTEDT